MFVDFDDEQCKLDDAYTEILKLDKMLKNASIPHVLQRSFDGWQVVYPSNGKNRVADVIEHLGSYGSGQDLLEIYGLLTPEEKEYDAVVGYLTADNVFNRINNDWNKES